VNYIFHWLPHFVIFVAFLSFLYSTFMHFNFCHIPFSKPTSSKDSALITSQRKGHNISQTLRLRERRPNFEKCFVEKADKTVIFVTRILEVPGSNVGQSQNVLRFFVGFLFIFRYISGYFYLVTKDFFNTLYSNHLFTSYHPSFDAVCYFLPIETLNK